MSRAQRSLFGDWWWTIDRALLTALCILMVAGLVFLMGGAPPVAERLSLPTFHFVNRQVFYLLPALMILLVVSFFPPQKIRRFALITYVTSLVLVLAALKFGPEIKGAHRWVSVMGIGIQPSEFLKPAFVILAAWLFSEGGKQQNMPGGLLGFLLLPITIGPLLLQPDLGQTLLITMVWFAIAVVGGLHWFWFVGFVGLGAAGIFIAYEVFPHVKARIAQFIDKSSGDTFQVDTAIESFVQGGWLGLGPGEGSIKRILPDAHTDFIFAVTAEEFGILVCLGVLLIYAFIVLRGLHLAKRSDDSFCRLATTGLVGLFGLQASINMAVNVHLIPAKGMTLPFISYGGSSLISLALGMGFLIALTRRRPRSHAGEILTKRESAYV